MDKRNSGRPGRDLVKASMILAFRTLRQSLQCVGHSGKSKMPQRALYLSYYCSATAPPLVCWHAWQPEDRYTCILLEPRAASSSSLTDRCGGRRTPIHVSHFRHIEIPVEEHGDAEKTAMVSLNSPPAISKFRIKVEHEIRYTAYGQGHSGKRRLSTIEMFDTP